MLGVAGAASAQPAPGAALRVVVAGSEPFVVAREGYHEGLSVEVWDAIAQGAGLAYALRPVPSVSAGLDAVASGQADVLVGPVSITAERAERVRFTQPYHQSSLAILTRAEAPSHLRRVAPLVSRRLFAGIGVLLAVLSLVGTLMWLAERKKNPEQFPPGVIGGVGNGVWFALVTMSTVGYGDRFPKTSLGRVVAGVWMVLALLTASSLTAGIASALTVAQLTLGAIENAEQLAGRNVAVVSGTPALRFAHRHRAKVREVANLAALVDALQSRRVDAAVFDRPQLEFYLQRHPDAGLTLSHARYMPQGYGFALAPDSPLLHPLNLSLLRAQESGLVSRVTAEWLGVSHDE